MDPFFQYRYAFPGTLYLLSAIISCYTACPQQFREWVATVIGKDADITGAVALIVALLVAVPTIGFIIEHVLLALLYLYDGHNRWGHPYWHPVKQHTWNNAPTLICSSQRPDFIVNNIPEHSRQDMLWSLFRHSLQPDTLSDHLRRRLAGSMTTHSSAVAILLGMLTSAAFVGGIVWWPLLTVGVIALPTLATYAIRLPEQKRKLAWLCRVGSVAFPVIWATVLMFMPAGNASFIICLLMETGLVAVFLWLGYHFWAELAFFEKLLYLSASDSKFSQHLGGLREKAERASRNQNSVEDAPDLENEK